MKTILTAIEKENFPAIQMTKMNTNKIMTEVGHPSNTGCYLRKSMDMDIYILGDFLIKMYDFDRNKAGEVCARISLEEKGGAKRALKNRLSIKDIDQIHLTYIYKLFNKAAPYSFYAGK